MMPPCLSLSLSPSPLWHQGGFPSTLVCVTFIPIFNGCRIPSRTWLEIMRNQFTNIFHRAFACYPQKRWLKKIYHPKTASHFLPSNRCRCLYNFKASMQGPFLPLSRLLPPPCNTQTKPMASLTFCLKWSLVWFSLLPFHRFRCSSTRIDFIQKVKFCDKSVSVWEFPHIVIWSKASTCQKISYL